MKRVHLQVAAIAILGSALPLLALAQFKGPTASPVNGNVPGVIWDETAGGTQNAIINISGKATIGGSAILNGGATVSNGATVNGGATINSGATINGGATVNSGAVLNGDVSLLSTKALRIDQNGASTYYFGNWGGAGGTQKPLTIYMNGDLQVSDLGVPPAQGNRGRVQATQFCFNPGNPSDCISAWPATSTPGLYVLKAGDTMTGTLYASSSLEVAPNFKYSNTTGGSLISGAYMGNGAGYGQYKALLEVKDSSTGAHGSDGSGGRDVQFITSSGVGQNSGSYNIQSLINNSAFPNGGAGDFESGAGNVLIGSANEDITLNNGLPGSFISGFLGYVDNSFPANPTAYGVSMQAKGGHNNVVAGYFSNTSGTSVTLAGPKVGVFATAPVVANSVAGQFTEGATALEGLTDAANGVGVYGAAYGPGNAYGGEFSGTNTGLSGSSLASGGVGGRFTAPYIGIDVDVTSSTGEGAFIGNGLGGTSAILGTSAQAAEFENGAGTDGLAAGSWYGLWGSDNTAGGGDGVYGYSNNGVGVYAVSENAESIEFSNNGTDNGYAGATGCGGTTTGISLNNLSMIGNCTNYNLMSNASNGNLNISRPTGGDIYFRENGGTSQVDIQSGGNVGIGTTSPNNLLTVNGTADKPGGGSWGTFSDIRLKDIDGSFNLGLDAIDQLNPVIYNYKTDNALGLPSDKQYVGLIAQNVQAAIPQAVTTDTQGYLILNNDPVIMTMLNSIKELKAQNDEMQKEIDQLKAQAK